MYVCVGGFFASLAVWTLLWLYIRFVLLAFEAVNALWMKSFFCFVVTFISGVYSVFHFDMQQTSQARVRSRSPPPVDRDSRRVLHTLGSLAASSLEANMPV